MLHQFIVVTSFLTYVSAIKCYSCTGGRDCQNPSIVQCFDTDFQCYTITVPNIGNYLKFNFPTLQLGCTKSCENNNLLFEKCKLCNEDLCNTEAPEEAITQYVNDLTSFKDSESDYVFNEDKRIVFSTNNYKDDSTSATWSDNSIDGPETEINYEYPNNEKTVYEGCHENNKLRTRRSAHGSRYSGNIGSGATNNGYKGGIGEGAHGTRYSANIGSGATNNGYKGGIGEGAHDAEHKTGNDIGVHRNYWGTVGTKVRRDSDLNVGNGAYVNGRSTVGEGAQTLYHSNIGTGARSNVQNGIGKGAHHDSI